jgi:hypothetical protein
VNRRSALPAAILCVLAVCLSHPRSARAESDVLVIGGVTAERGQLIAVRGAVENSLRKAGWSWPARPPSQKEADSLLKCEDSRSPWTCIPAMISGLRGPDVQRVFVLSVESGSGPSPVVVLTARIIVASTPPGFVVRQRFCEQCSVGKLVQASEELTRQLFSELAARAAATAIDVTSDPPDADVRLDGSPAGKTHARLATTAGKHLVSIAKPDFISEVRTVNVEQGQTLAVSVTLRAAEGATPLPPPPPPPDENRAFPWVPVLTLTAGAGLVAFGGYALYLGQLGGPADPYRYTRATPVGIVSIALGLGAAGAGLWLWRRPDGSGLFGTVEQHRSFISWSGRF